MKEKELNKKVQATLNKLISDEWFAGQIYRNFVMIVDPKQRQAIHDEMLDVASDEINDHYKKLVEYAISNGYDVPASYLEIKKFADSADVKLFEKTIRNKDAKYYVKLGIDSEKRAIEAYEEALNAKEVLADVELEMILKNNYYDELDHLSKFEFMLNSLVAMDNFPS